MSSLFEFWRRSDRLALSLLLVRAATMSQGLLVAVALVACLDPGSQGKWYALIGILNIAGYSELGIGQVIVQVIAHDHGENAFAWDKRAAQFRAIVRFSALAAVGYALLIAVAGVVVFWKLTASEWLDTWPMLAALSVSGGALFVLGPINCFFEGCQRVTEVNLRRFAQIAVYTIVCVGGLFSGLKSWALVLGQFVAASAATVMLFRQHRLELAELRRAPECAIAWGVEFWPLQRRYAMSWLAGILYASALSPLLFRLKSAEEAGRFGLSWSVINVVLGVSMVWLASRASLFAAAVGGKKHDEFADLFRRQFLRTVGWFGSLIALMLGAIWIVVTHSEHVAARIVSIPTFMVMSVAAGFLLLNQAAAFYVRSFKEEPLVKEMWLSSAIILLAAAALAPLWGALGVAVAVTIGQLISVPLTWRKVRLYARRIQRNESGHVGV